MLPSCSITFRIAVQLVFIERADLHQRIYIRLAKNACRARVSDPEDVRQANSRLLVIRDIRLRRYVPSSVLSELPERRPVSGVVVSGVIPRGSPLASLRFG